LLTRALAVLQKTAAPDDLRIRRTLWGLANTYSGLGRLEESKLLLERELEHAERAVGPNHPEIAGILDRLAQRYTYGSVEVEPMLTRALAILEQHGVHDWYTWHVHWFLDAFYRSRGRYAEAEAVIKRALAIAEKSMQESVPHFLGDLA
jgi:tetratricopeptide (TPR) repeat protein